MARSRQFQPRWVEGKTVVSVRMNRRKGADGQTLYDPVFVFSDGSRCACCVLEDSDESGVGLLYLPVRAKG